MKNMKVSMKLIVAFLIVIVLAVAVGVVGIVGMSMINSADDAMYNDNYLPTIMAGNISQAIVEQRVYSRNFVIYDVNLDSATYQATINNYNKSKTDMQALLDEYDGTITEQEDRDAFNEFVSVYNNQWLPGLEIIYERGAANDTEGAKKALTDITSAADRMDELSTILQQVNMNMGELSVNGNTALFNTLTIVEIAVLAFAVAVSMFMALYISSLISKPLALLTAFMNKAGSTGDIHLSREDEETIKRFAQNKDETGQCIGSTAAFIKRLTDVAEALETVANGDLTKELALLSNQDMMGLSLKKMNDNLNSMFSEINASTAQVAVGSKQIADGAQALAQGSTQQAAAVEELSSSIAEIAEKTKDNANMASSAATLAETIKGNAEKGSQQMNQLTQAVKEINDANQNISKVIGLIDNIAFQTNILALNAAVEAARAGQHGKGFAVVAEEVRSLATKSADAAKETGGMIANSMEKAELGARIAGETAESLAEIVSGINESSRLVDDIARSSEEQSTGIAQINKGIDQVAQVIQQNSATAEESAASSEEMSGQSNMLEELIAQFKLRDGGNHAMLGGRSKSPAKRLEMPEKTSYKPAAGNGEDFGKY